MRGRAATRFRNAIGAVGGSIAGTTGTGAALVPGASVTVNLGATPKVIGNPDNETVVVSMIIPANTMRAGDVIAFTASAGRTGANTASPTMRIRIGPTTLNGVEAYIGSGLTTVNPGGSFWQGTVQVHTINGASSKANGGGQQGINIGASDAAVNNSRVLDATFDSTVENKIELTFKSGNTANVYTFNCAVLTYGRSAA